MSLINIAKIDFSPSEGGGGGDAKIQSSKTVKISLEGEQTFVTPDSGYDAMAVVTVNHDPVQAEKNITINQNGEVIITPDNGNAAMSKAKVIVDVPGAKEEVAGAAIIHDQGDYDFFPEEGKVFNKFHVYSAYIKQKPMQDKTVSITRNGLTVISPDEGWCLRDVTLDVNVPSTGTFVVPNGMKFAYWNGEPAGMSDWDYSAVTDGSNLFRSTNLNRSTIKDIVDHINWNNVTSISSIFQECYNLTGDAGDILPETWVLGENCMDMTSAFTSCYFEKIGNITALSQGGWLSAYNLFNSCQNLKEVGVLDFKPNEIAYAFSYCRNLKKIGGIDLTNVITHTEALFGYDFDENSQPRNLTDITFNGEINCNLTIPLPSLSVESVKSALSAASRTTKSDVQKTLTFNTIIVVDDADERDRINTMIALCVYKGWTVTGLTILDAAPITVDNDNLLFSKYDTTKQVRITHNGDERYSFETSYLRDEINNNFNMYDFFTWSTQHISENEDMLTITQTSSWGVDMTGTFTVKDNATGYRANIAIFAAGDNVSIDNNPTIGWNGQGRAMINNSSSHLVSIDLNTSSVEDPNERLYDYVTPVDEGTIFYIDPHYGFELVINYDKKPATQNLTFNLEIKDDNGIVRNILVVNLYAG